MNTQTLIYSIVGIFVISAGAYFVVSPIARNSLDAPLVQEYKQESVEEPQQIKEEEGEKEEEKEKNDSVIIQKDVETKPIVQTQTTTQPSPKPPVLNEPQSYSTSEVALRSSAQACWSIVNGVVYDLTTYISKHPGGEKNILRICGVDGTRAFEGEHGGESRPEKILAGYKIGILK